VGYHQAQKVLKWPHGIWAETAYPVEWLGYKLGE
jgi:hypothetical protein